MKFLKVVMVALTPLVFISCAEDELNVADIQETAQQIGDVMASVDESGGTTDGTVAFMEGQRKFMAVKDKQLPSNLVQDVFDLFTPIKSAQAVACKDTAFSSCSSGQKIRDLNGCTIGSATFTGTVTLDFSDAACAINSDGDDVDRSPDFTVTGRREATLTVTKTATNGQTLTRVSAGNFTFANDGIRRVFAAGGTALFDFTTLTTSPITVTGSDRATRVMTGGNLRVTNNKTSVSCNYVPNNVTWSASCNCASSGSWEGSCSDGKTSSVEITGCGSATITVDETAENLTFDRCYNTN
ncbi:MAG: hypothetical protein IT287_05270 [Bdellovibrionaceae bacterium]|nr:hypothetical protein [Pseudobdellovibrionaceae bacterium]